MIGTAPGGGQADQLTQLSNEVQRISAIVERMQTEATQNQIRSQQTIDQIVAKQDNAARAAEKLQQQVSGITTGQTTFNGVRVTGRFDAVGAIVQLLATATGKMGFWGKAAVVRPEAYTLTNHVARRTMDESAITLPQLANFVGTLVTDDQSTGLRG